MSNDIYSSVVKTNARGMNRERVEMVVEIYESADDFRTQTDSNTNTSQPLQSTGSECVMNRRSVIVCLLLLCVLLLTAVIVLCVLINTNNHQYHINNKNITEERDKLLPKYTNITEERDQLLPKYTNITEERDQLLTKYTNITEERDQLLTKYTNITEERDELKNDIIKLQQLLNQKRNEACLHDIWINYKSSIYLLSSDKKSWTESRRDCRERGADLVIINNTEENEFVQKITGGEIVWIGLSDSDEEGRWKWVDDSTLNTRFWKSGEPNGQRKENCVEFVSSEWNDKSCNVVLKWLCERNTFK